MISCVKQCYYWMCIFHFWWIYYCCLRDRFCFHQWNCLCKSYRTQKINRSIFLFSPPPSLLVDSFPVAEKNERHYNGMQISLQTVYWWCMENANIRRRRRRRRSWKSSEEYRHCRLHHSKVCFSNNNNNANNWTNKYMQTVNMQQQQSEYSTRNAMALLLHIYSRYMYSKVYTEH